jgi:flagellar basal-body rod modification protein FlgD
MSIINQVSQTAARINNVVQAATSAASPAPTGSTNGTASTGSQNSLLNPSQAGVQSEFTTFLTLLTTELKNQDPSSPLDTNQFTSQLVQFSQLEQTLNTNSDLQTLINGQQQGAIGGALSYLGHTVEATGGNFVLDGSNAADLNYNLASNAASTTINVMNSSGQTIASFPGDTGAGQNSVSYNGTYPGQPTLPAGQYSYQVVATDSTGNAVQATAYTTGMVTGVDSSNGAVELHLGNIVIPASSVVQVTS